MTTHPAINIFSPHFRTDPYGSFASLREQGPVARVTLPDGRSAKVVVGYDAVVAVLKDDRFIKDYTNLAEDKSTPRRVPAGLRQFAVLSNNMLRKDPPDHTRLRSLVSKAFTPRRIEQLAPRIQQIADDLLNEMAKKGEVDLIDAYAFPLPIIVISELLGIPVEDRDKFRHWSNLLVGSLGELLVEEQQMIKATSAIGFLRRFAPWRMDRLRLLNAVNAFIRYVRRLIATRRANPQNDLVSALIQAEAEGDKLSEDELISMIILLLAAGHETTVNLIGNGTLALLRNPEQLAQVKANPDAIKTVIEELLRYNNPVNMVTRIASEDITVGGETITRGERIFVAIAAANHDPAHFANPEDLDVLRAENRHLGFGQGIHFCLGAPLARLEGQIALSALLRRFPDLQLAIDPDALEWRTGFLLHGLDALPVRLT
ncbi:MAG: cytochrome P450 [Caldilineaceae bacterium]|nr:cytochrome P450 [Caldilineaceae bacterium]